MKHLSENKLNELKLLFDDIPFLCRHLFKDDRGLPLEISSYQVEIIECILFNRYRKILCWATTRAGKSLAVALALILKAVFCQGERIRIIAPTDDHTRIVMGYVIQHIFDSPIIYGCLSVKADLAIERLKKELSKSKITWKNGNDIMIKSASILQDGRSLVGFGGTTIVVDEAEGIPAEIIRSKIMRMLGDSPDSQIFLISNPVQKGYMFDSMQDSSWHQILVNWQTCVAEGRLTKEFVLERKSEMTSVEFTIWYDSVYPDEGDDQLIKSEWVKKAVLLGKTFKGKVPDFLSLGVDVASMGTDFTVYSKTGVYGEFFNCLSQEETGKTETMQTVGKIGSYLSVDSYRFCQVDSTGLGSGVVDRCKELSREGTVLSLEMRKVVGINFAQSPYDKVKKRNKIKDAFGVEEKPHRQAFLNAKAEMYFNLRRLFEKGLIGIPDDFKLKDQLVKIRFEFTSSGKVKIIDPLGHSPDQSDSLALSVYLPPKSEVIFGEVDFGGF